MKKEDYLNDLSEIKNLMSRSSRFISLSGLSGVLAGLYALIGGAYIDHLVGNYSRGTLILDGWVFRRVIFVLGLVLLLSIGSAIWLTTRKAKKKKQKTWDRTTKRLLLSFLTPLLSGGIYILIILSQQRYGQTAGLMLLFYGFSLVNASKHTYSAIQYLGYLEIILGLLASYFEGFGFWFWMLGFGLFHIVYGLWMYFTYDRKD